MTAHRSWRRAPAVVSREVLGATDEPVFRYNSDIDAATSKEALIDALCRWPVLAPDALEQAKAITNWSDFRRCLHMERHGRFMGEEATRRYGCILIPSLMLRVSMVVAQFKVPFGLAYLRLWEMTEPAP